MDLKLMFSHFMKGETQIAILKKLKQPLVDKMSKLIVIYT